MLSGEPVGDGEAGRGSITLGASRGGQDTGRPKVVTMLIVRGGSREPFVADIDVMIDKLVENIPNAAKGFRLIFSPTPSPGYTVKLEWRREEYGGNWYSPQFNVEGWLCPALFKYFPKAPQELYGRAEAKSR